MSRQSVGTACIRLRQNDKALAYISIKDLNDVGMGFLVEAMEQNTVVKEMILSSPSFTPRGADLFERLLTQSCIKILRIWSTQHRGTIPAPLFRSLASADTSLETLWLVGDRIGVDNGDIIGAASALREMLQSNASLTELYLRENKISSLVTIVMSEGLKHNRSLAVLDLNGNEIDDAGAEAIIQSLPPTLLHLDLSCNGIANAGARAIATALALNNTLQTLDLDGTRITQDGIMAFAESLPQMRGLKRLHLCTPARLDLSLLRALQKGLESNLELEQLFLDSRGPQQEQADFQNAKDIIKYYLRLNRGHRRILFSDEPPSASLWPRILAKVDSTTSQVDVLYYFITAVPELLCCAAAGDRA